MYLTTSVNVTIADGPALSATLFALHITSRRWTRVPGDERVAPHSHLSARYFHSSALVGDLMLIVGGRNLTTEATLESYVYNINCNAWMQLEGYCECYYYFHG